MIGSGPWWPPHIYPAVSTQLSTSMRKSAAKLAPERRLQSNGVAIIYEKNKTDLRQSRFAVHSFNHSSEHTVGICQMVTAKHPAYAVSSSPRAILQRNITYL